MDILLGSTLTVNLGSVVGSVIADSSSRVNLLGGAASFVSVVDSSVLEVFGGEIGGVYVRNSTVNFAGGESTQRVLVDGDSLLNMTNGSISELRVSSSSTSEILGGTILGEVFAGTGSTFNISGGIFLGNFVANSESQINLMGTQFILDGTDISGLLTLDVPFVLNERDVNLVAILKDGGRFDYDLSSVRNRINPNQFSPNSTLTLTRVASVPLLGDVNLSGVVDFLDIPAFIAVLQSGVFQAEADCDESGMVDFGDIPAFIAILIAS